MSINPMKHSRIFMHLRKLFTSAVGNYSDSLEKVIETQPHKSEDLST